MRKKKIVEILKTGNFTIVYHDSDYCTLVNKKFEDYDSVKGKAIEFEGFEEGYIHLEVAYLVEALGGSVVSI